MKLPTITIITTFLTSIQISLQINEEEANIDAKYQRELRFDAVDHPAEYSWLQCRDYPDWKNAMNHTCADMAEIIPKGGLDGYLDDGQMYDDEDYDDKFDYCSFFGGYYHEDNTAGLTANEACCACGGGIPEFELCNNFQTPEGNDWTDATGRNCDAYAQHHLCYKQGDSYPNWGMTANQACCACRGGAIGTCQDYEDFVTNDYEATCDYFSEKEDLNQDTTRCWEDGEDLGKYFDGTVEATVNDACCVCGGGVSTLDYPSFSPAVPTTPKPSASPSSSSSVSTSFTGSTSSTDTGCYWDQFTLRPTLNPNASSFQLSSSSFHVTSLLAAVSVSLILELYKL